MVRVFSFCIKLVATRYFSKKVRAAKRPYPSARPECASRLVPGTVPSPVQRSLFVVAIVHENAPNLWAFNEASVTMNIWPLSCVRYWAR